MNPDAPWDWGGYWEPQYLCRTLLLHYVWPRRKTSARMHKTTESGPEDCFSLKKEPRQMNNKQRTL